MRKVLECVTDNCYDLGSCELHDALYDEYARGAAREVERQRWNVRETASRLAFGLMYEYTNMIEEGIELPMTAEAYMRARYLDLLQDSIDDAMVFAHTNGAL
jgi:hypothetical protein